MKLGWIEEEEQRSSSSTSSSLMSSSSSSSSWLSGIVRGRSFNPKTNSAVDQIAANRPRSGSLKNQLHGSLFKYGSKPVQVAFKTGDFKQQVIFVGGLTDGLLATEYLVPLSIALENEKWSLVQPLLTSSYIGYGTSSLKQDSMELDQLIGYLINKENSEGVVLLGHSTGCQVIVHYMRTNAACSRAVRAAILQAPVSDREYRATLPETAEMIDLAATMISEGRAMDLLPREANPDAPITAYRFHKIQGVPPLVMVWISALAERWTQEKKFPEYEAYLCMLLSAGSLLRYHSLCAYMGDDDMFSSDLSDDQLRLRLGHMSNTPCQVLFSMADEYVPEYVDKKALVERLCKAMGGADKVEIEYGNHSLSNRVEEAVQAIIDFVKREGPNGWDDPWS